MMRMTSQPHASARSQHSPLSSSATASAAVVGPPPSRNSTAASLHPHDHTAAATTTDATAAATAASTAAVTADADTRRRRRCGCWGWRVSDSWESVATSWVLPDAVQAAWRVLLLAGVAATFGHALQARRSSVRLFSVDAYALGLAGATALLLPCAAALVWPQAVQTWGGVWFGVTSVYASAVCGYATIAAGYMGVVGATWFEADARHLVPLAMLVADALLGATELRAPHLGVAGAFAALYVGAVLAGWRGSPWMRGVVAFDELLAAGAAGLTFTLAALGLLALVRGRGALARYLSARAARRTARRIAQHLDEEQGDGWDA